MRICPTVSEMNPTMLGELAPLSYGLYLLRAALPFAEPIAGPYTHLVEFSVLPV